VVKRLEVEEVVVRLCALRLAKKMLRAAEALIDLPPYNGKVTVT